MSFENSKGHILIEIKEKNGKSYLTFDFDFTKDYLFSFFFTLFIFLGFGILIGFPDLHLGVLVYFLILGTFLVFLL